MRAQLASTLFALALLAAGGAALGADAAVTGQVVNPDGTPAAGVVVGTDWRTADGAWKSRKGVRTDDEGRFTMQTRVSSRAATLMAFDESQELGVAALLSQETATEPFRLTLQKTTLVEGRFESPDLEGGIERAWVSFTRKPATIAVARYDGAPSYSVRLPPGDYTLSVGAVDCMRVRQTVTAKADAPTVDLGVTTLQPTIIARHYGKAPPELHVTDARGVDPSVTLADYEGKWVLIEFWGFW